MTTLRWCLLFGWSSARCGPSRVGMACVVALVGTVVGGGIGLAISRNVINLKALLGNRDDE